MEVEPRKYRFRLLNAAVSRSFGLYFATEENNTTRIAYDVIASDAGLLSSPAETTQLVRYPIPQPLIAY
jgi:bilirubin oxidase